MWDVIGDIAFWLLAAICIILVFAVLFYSDTGE